MMARRSPVAIGLLAPLLALTLAGCALSGGTTPPPGAPTPSEPSTAPVPTPTPTVASPTLTISVPTDATGSPSTTPSASDRVITVPIGTERQLSEADAASPGTWIRGTFAPAGSAAPVESLAQAVLCGESPAPLEFRFADTAGTLTVGAAQAATSASSNETLTWTLVTDGRLQQTRRVAFRDAVDLTVPLAGVAKVTIQVSNQDTCSGSATALITKAAVKG